MTKSLKGINAAVPTPFDAHEDLALDALANNLERWNETRLSGYTVLGTTGEFVALTSDEKKKVLETARSAIPADKTMLAGTGAESTRETLALTRFAAEIGCDYAIVVTPHYNRWSSSPDALVAHYEAVADASAVPIVLYHIPACTGLELTPETIARISRHPNVHGIKDSSGDLEALERTRGLCDDAFHILTGAVPILLDALESGASGAILADACPATELSTSVYDAYVDGNRELARTLQKQLATFSHVLIGRYGIPGVKALLDELGFYGGPPRRPLQSVPTPGRHELKEALERETALS